MKHSTGVTLIELMIAVALFAIVLTLGVPSFQKVIENNSLATRLNILVTTLNYARSEAVKRGKRVSVCKSDDGVDCGAGGYEDGWIVFVEEVASGDGTRQVATEELIQIRESLNANMTLRGNNNFINFISFMPTGEANNIGRFVLCKESDLEKSRAIFVIRTGRVRLAKDENNDNIPEDELGNNITSCTPP
ncbi:MAG: GspH/FimT family pseudopilin [Pseudomonadota bacterium]